MGCTSIELTIYEPVRRLDINCGRPGLGPCYLKLVTEEQLPVRITHLALTRCFMKEAPEGWYGMSHSMGSWRNLPGLWLIWKCGPVA